MYFGLLNAPASLQSYIKKILTKKFDVFIIIHSDHILIYTKDTSQAHVNAIWWVLEELKKHGFLPS